MPTDVGGLVVALLFFAPGVVYDRSRAHELRRAKLDASSFRSDPVEVTVMTLIASTFITSMALVLLWSFQWFLRWLEDVAGKWLDSSMFGPVNIPASILPSPDAWLAQGWDYVDNHLRLVGITTGVTFLLALVLARFLGAQRGRTIVFTQGSLREQELLTAIRSRAVVRLKSGTIYSGILLHPPQEGSVLGDELILYAPIQVQTGGMKRMLQTGVSIALASSEIASLTLADGENDRLYLFSDAVPPTWVRSG
jgi:hypothetical protein